MASNAIYDMHFGGKFEIHSNCYTRISIGSYRSHLDSPLVTIFHRVVVGWWARKPMIVRSKLTHDSFLFSKFPIFMQKLGLKVSENHELYNFAHFRKVEASMGIMYEFKRP